MVVFHQQNGDRMDRVDARKVKIQLASQGLTQESLARLLETPPSTLSAWLRGVNPQPEDLLVRVARVLSVRRDWIKSKE